MYSTKLLFGFEAPQGIMMAENWLRTNYPVIEHGALLIDADGSIIQTFYGVEPELYWNSLTSLSLVINPSKYSTLERFAQYVANIYFEEDEIVNRVNNFVLKGVIVIDVDVEIETMIKDMEKLDIPEDVSMGE